MSKKVTRKAKYARRGLGIVISIGRWDPPHIKWGWMFRICLGFVALTIIPRDGDDIILAASEYGQILMAVRDHGAVTIEPSTD